MDVRLPTKYRLALVAPSQILAVAPPRTHAVQRLRLRHDHRHSGFHSSVRSDGHGRSSVCSAGSGLHRFHPVIVGGVADGHASAVLLDAGPIEADGS